MSIRMPGEVASVSEGWPSISSLGEVGVLTGQGWPSTFTSSTCRPMSPSGSARTGLDAHRPASVLREAEDSAPSAGVGTGAAKAAYMRDRRARASRRRAMAEFDGTGRAPVEGITHGYAGYQEHHCRCDVCRAAKSAADRGAA